MTVSESTVVRLGQCLDWESILALGQAIILLEIQSALPIEQIDNPVGRLVALHGLQ
jgi:hypothetical protein